MEIESHNIEWKEGWRDEYLKWICGFANANGEQIFIGKDNKGKVVGNSNAKKLLEDIPNKPKNILGIIVDVNLHSVSGGDTLKLLLKNIHIQSTIKVNIITVVVVLNKS